MGGGIFTRISKTGGWVPGGEGHRTPGRQAGVASFHLHHRHPAQQCTHHPRTWASTQLFHAKLAQGYPFILSPGVYF